MRFEQLEYIAAVTRLGSLRRAGEELHISQPALSETVRNLERELGVTLLDRQRSGARISADGRELLPHIVDVLDAVDRLRAAADDQHRSRRTIRIGTASAASAALLAPAIQEFAAALGGTQVEVMTTQPGDVHLGLAAGSIDLGLVSLLDGDDYPPQISTDELLRGRPVVCCVRGHVFSSRAAVTLDDLSAEPIVAMRAGYVMHRFLHRAYQGHPPAFAYTSDGADMGKLMVAQGLGVTVLPDYSVIDDPLHGAGLIVARPLDTGTRELGAIRLVLQHRRVRHMPQALRAMHDIITAHARKLALPA
ncbi:MAG TPA: LysR family transcriptional regulator [Jatrophihabitans sp.]|nr:LysR family transcriptional regulator [Jatrophihabitans sp.]